MAEKITNLGDGKLVISNHFDIQPHFKRLQKIKDGMPVLGVEKEEGQFMGSINRHVFEQKLKERGVSFGDREAVEQILVEMLNDSDFNKFRANTQKVQSKGLW